MLRPFERRKEKNLNQFKIINIFIKFSVLGYLKKIELKDISRKYKVCWHLKIFKIMFKDICNNIVINNISIKM